MSRDHYRELTKELNIGYEEERLKMIQILNAEQRAGFDLIMNYVEKKIGQVFFVNGLGRTGKTYFYKALLVKVHSMNLIAIATATSGIAASIVPGGRTAHSHFKIPIKLDNNTMCSFTKQSGTAELRNCFARLPW
jgi:hypothetical protein